MGYPGAWRFPDALPAEHAALKGQYDAMGHPYHNWTHIQTMLADFDTMRHTVRDADAVELAIYFHDVIYVPGAQDNEVASAQHLVRMLVGYM